MDKYERRRVALKTLTDSFGKGGIAHVADKIGKSASYVSRMLYPEGKAGKKRIGEDSVEAISKVFPGWCAEDEAGAIRANAPQRNGTDGGTDGTEAGQERRLTLVYSGGVEDELKRLVDGYRLADHVTRRHMLRMAEEALENFGRRSGESNL